MQIKITGGYVEVSDKITRKVARGYNMILAENSEMSPNGDYRITPKAVDLSREFIVREMIEKIVMIGQDGVEVTLPFSKEWFDGLDEHDYQDIGDKVLEILNDSRSRSKK